MVQARAWITFLCVFELLTSLTLRILLRVGGNFWTFTTLIRQIKHYLLQNVCQYRTQQSGLVRDRYTQRRHFCFVLWFSEVIVWPCLQFKIKMGSLKVIFLPLLSQRDMIPGAATIYYISPHFLLKWSMPSLHLNKLLVCENRSEKTESVHRGSVHAKLHLS